MLVFAGMVAIVCHKLPYTSYGGSGQMLAIVLRYIGRASFLSMVK